MADRLVKIGLTAKSKRDLKSLATGTERQKVFSSLLHVMGRRGVFVASAISKDMLAGQRLKIREGNLSKSITSEASLIGGLPGVRVGIFRGPALAYAGVQEFGTKGKAPDSPYPTIKPKNAKALAMPVGSALTPSGRVRYGGPRDYPFRLRFVPFKRGIAVGALYPETELKKEQKAARREKRPVDLNNAEAAFLLLKQVDIPPHEFLKDGMANALPALAEDVGDEIARIVKGGAA